LGVEREANRASFRVTHWVVPSVPARSPREPRFMRALSDYGLIRSPLKTKMWANRLLTKWIASRFFGSTRSKVP
jgi:hypothetical protein